MNEPPAGASGRRSPGRRVICAALGGLAASLASGLASPVRAARGAAEAVLGEAAPGASVARRTALVFGNGEYPDATLRNPVPDARLVGRTLSELGFDVTLSVNAGLTTMRNAMRRWLIDSADADVRAFYFAGHGVQYRGSSYLIPVDAVFEAEEEILTKAFNLQDLVDRLARTETGVNFVVLDACRADPKALLTRVTRRSRSLDKPESGLAATAAPRGTVIAYSTSPGALAADGVGQVNSVFTRALAQWMQRPGMTIEAVFKRVRMTVMKETQNAQVPWETSSLIGDFCLRPNSRGECGPEI
ncbi:MAG: caspase family protein [Burkholderiaceae bacterium]|jgi:uncharacterized caspase-like protein